MGHFSVHAMWVILAPKVYLVDNVDKDSKDHHASNSNTCVCNNGYSGDDSNVNVILATQGLEPIVMILMSVSQNCIIVTPMQLALTRMALSFVLVTFSVQIT